jgi:hypothetical protein
MRIHRLRRYPIAVFLLSASPFLLVLLYGRIYGLTFVRYSHIEEDQVTCTNPPPNSSNAIAILASHDDFWDVASRLTQLDARLQDNCSSTILLFHTGFPFASEMKRIRNSTYRRVIFQNVDQYFALFPKNFNPYLTEPTFWKRGKWNYHQMIRFWFKHIFETDKMQQFDYVMRLDTDSRLLGKWYNVFELMKVKQLIYLANEENAEVEKVLPGTMKLQTFFVEYQHKMRLVPQDQAKVNSAFTKDTIRIYYNNFEVFQTKFFRQTDVRAWIDAIDGTHGIYKYRWGDAMLRYLTLALFAKDYQVAHRKHLNLSYCHPC